MLLGVKLSLSRGRLAISWIPIIFPWQGFASLPSTLETESLSFLGVLVFQSYSWAAWGEGWGLVLTMAFPRSRYGNICYFLADPTFIPLSGLPPHPLLFVKAWFLRRQLKFQRAWNLRGEWLRPCPLSHPRWRFMFVFLFGDQRHHLASKESD